ARPDLRLPDRKQLVGLLTDNPNEVLDEGAQIVEDPNQPIPMRMLGHVPSSYMSPNCGRSIALALVAGGRARIGTTLHVTTPSGFTTARVSEPVFFDPKGERVHA
ncbi:MAG TPA: glycine cleavage T C-terminal barrel domain-containing protein, partial [Microvirga sp.]|nr:glycine cleavage T C-terminal barrel domain-containing protein [Microvirga sp.]